jgi:hypothetical protein
LNLTLAENSRSRSASWPLIITVVLLSSTLLSFLRFNDIPVGSFWDDAHYVVLAESLSQGSGYRLINQPHAPIETAFPPGYPLLLVPFVTLFPQNYLILKLVSLAFWLGAIWLFYSFLQGRLATPYREVVTLLVAVNPYLIGMSTTVMSESFFLFTTLASLTLLDKWEKTRHENSRSPWLYLIGALVAATLAILIRTVAITFLAGMLLYLLLRLGRQQLKWLGVVLAGLLLLLLPFAWFNANRGGSTVFSPLYTHHVDYVGQNIGLLLGQWHQALDIGLVVAADSVLPVLGLGRFANFVGAPLHMLLMGLLMVVLLLGYFLSLRQAGAVALYCLFYGGLLYFWVVYTAELRSRMLLPIIPFLYLYLALAIIWLVGKVGQRVEWIKKNKRPLLINTLALLLLISLVRNLHEWQNPVSDQVLDLTAGVAWIQVNTPPEAILMSPNATPEYLYHHRQTVYPPAALIPLDLDDQAIQTHIDQHRIDYIIVRPHLHQWNNDDQRLDFFTENYLVPFLQANPQQYEPVYRSEQHNLAIYQVNRQQ